MQNNKKVVCLRGYTYIIHLFYNHKYANLQIDQRELSAEFYLRLRLFFCVFYIYLREVTKIVGYMYIGCIHICKL